MATTDTNSDLMATIEVEFQRNPRNLSKAETRIERFTCVQGSAAGDAPSTFRVCKLPAYARYLAPESRVRFSAYGAARVLSFGWEAHRDAQTGAAIDADLTGLGTGLDVSAAGVATLDSLTSAVDDKEFQGEVVLVARCTGGTLPAGATLTGQIAYLLP